MSSPMFQASPFFPYVLTARAIAQFNAASSIHILSLYHDSQAKNWRFIHNQWQGSHCHLVDELSNAKF